MSRSRGFTLIEVVVALAVIATALYAATGSVRAAARGSGHLELTTLAHWAALNQLHELKLGAATIETDQATIVEMYGNEFTVSAELQSEANEEPKRITVRVATKSAPNVPLYSLNATIQ
ncbi:MAG: type II secretion system protein GspI [Gammaproteobacteria bacterium]|nr:type II secretion system protein GspI [Gammaproteobacteria bacterium]